MPLNVSRAGSKSLSEKGSDPLRRGQKLHENDSPPKGQTPFRIGSKNHQVVSITGWSFCQCFSAGPTWAILIHRCFVFSLHSKVSGVISPCSIRSSRSCSDIGPTFLVRPSHPRFIKNQSALILAS